jgi:hypothetical protein
MLSKGSLGRQSSLKKMDSGRIPTHVIYKLGTKFLRNAEGNEANAGDKNRRGLSGMTFA